MTTGIGAICFGLVIGWVTYRTLRRKEGRAALSDIASVLAAVGGATVTGLFGTAELFGLYSIGLAVGFFMYLIIAARVSGNATSVTTWMGD